jgi:hypothetical protein
VSDEGYPRYLRPATHEFGAHLHFASDGLSPYFGFHSRLKRSDGRPQETTIEIEGEPIELTLKKKGSKLSPRDHPEYRLRTVPEYVLKAKWDDERKATFTISPRWPGIETTDGNRLSFDPDYVGINVHVQGSNLLPDAYPSVFRCSVQAFDVNPSYFREMRDSSVIYECERYVRLHRDTTGPLTEIRGVFDRVYSLAGEPNKRYRMQVDDSRKIEGYLAYVVLGTNAVESVFPNQSFAKQLKHYHPKHVRAEGGSDPLAHPKLGAKFKQDKNAGGSIPWSGRDELRRELDESLLNVLSWAGLPIRPDGQDDKAAIQSAPDGSDVFVPDSHFEAGEITEPEISILSDPLPDMRAEQTDAVRTALTGNPDLTESDVDVLNAVTDGGRPLPASDVADTSDWSLSTVYRAVTRLSELLEKRSEGIGIRSKYLRDALSESLQDAHSVLSGAVESNEDSDSSSAFAAWADAHGFQRSFDERGRLLLRLGTLSRSTDLKEVLKDGFRAWLRDGRDPAEYKSAKVSYRQGGKPVVADGFILS